MSRQQRHHRLGHDATIGAITPVAAGTVAVLRAQERIVHLEHVGDVAGQAIFVSSAQAPTGRRDHEAVDWHVTSAARTQAQSARERVLFRDAGPARVSAGLQRASLTLTGTNSGAPT